MARYYPASPPRGSARHHDRWSDITTGGKTVPDMRAFYCVLNMNADSGDPTFDTGVMC